ncbi:hypothetical protein [Paenibacillus bovis]|uniref:Uncharacterized protein n=1 Tax=Paenibacillus bovis TaxID=1616788 RepID=A0A172ZES2_9BACL|nr:hypothetical protein [Paenibacillus bovis]ANF96019.1 hypothetical protein AR543_08370 [Paenibacillus bovis]
MSPHQLEKLFTEGTINEDTLVDILHQCSVVPLLYDEGSQITVDDFYSRLENPLEGEVSEAAQALYATVVQAFRRFAEPESYELLQDCISLQEDLCMTGVLSVSDWIEWLVQAAAGETSLPTADFHSLFEDLPEGYMMQDFHDDLTYILEQPENPKYDEAVKQQQLLYTQLGVTD